MNSKKNASPVLPVVPAAEPIDQHQPRTPDRLVGNNPSDNNAGVGTDVAMLMASHWAPHHDTGTVFHHEPLVPGSGVPPIAQSLIEGQPASAVVLGSAGDIYTEESTETRGLPSHRLTGSGDATRRRVHWQHLEGNTIGFTAPLLDPRGRSGLKDWRDIQVITNLLHTHFTNAH